MTAPTHPPAPTLAETLAWLEAEAVSWGALTRAQGNSPEHSRFAKHYANALSCVRAVREAREKEMADAPVHYSHEAAGAWADGYNSCRTAILTALPEPPHAE